MRSPRRKGTVPSEAIATPSTCVMTSPLRSVSRKGHIGCSFFTISPLADPVSPATARTAGFSQRCSSIPRSTKPVYRPCFATSSRKWLITQVGMM